MLTCGLSRLLCHVVRWKSNWLHVDVSVFCSDGKQRYFDQLLQINNKVKTKDETENIKHARSSVLAYQEYGGPGGSNTTTRAGTDGVMSFTHQPHCRVTPVGLGQRCHDNRLWTLIWSYSLLLCFQLSRCKFIYSMLICSWPQCTQLILPGVKGQCTFKTVNHFNVFVYTSLFSYPNPVKVFY